MHSAPVTMINKALFALSFFAASVTADAAEVAGVKIDDKATLGGRELVLNGAGMRTRLIIKVYVGALYLPQKAPTAAAALAKDEPRRMSMTLQRDVNYEQLLEAMRAGLAENNSQAELDAIKPQVNEFTKIFTSVGEAKSGQVIWIDYTPEEGTKISVDGKSKGTVAGQAFNRALLRVWLGDNPVQESLKKALLGAG
jgi:long-chain acyl-CoA synthetase